MKVGDRARATRGEYLGRVSVITGALPVAIPTKLISHKLVETEHKKYFGCVADDGTMFFGFQDELEIIE